MIPVTFRSKEGERIALRFGLAALVAYERQYPDTVLEAVQRVSAKGSAVRFTELVPLVVAGLEDHKPGLTEADAIEIVNHLRVLDLMHLIRDAAGETFGQEEPDEEGGEEADAGNAPPAKTAGKKAARTG